MSDTLGFSIGDVVTNEDIGTTFKCANMAGMRRSHSTNTLVIISDFTKALYDDKWCDDELHYTGMGKSGDQSINYAQNKTLAESNSNGIEVHLFEVIISSQYIYRGQVYLIAEPYQEIQPDVDGTNRKAWIFPLKLRKGYSFLDNVTLQKYRQTKQNEAKKLSDIELKKRAQQTGSNKMSQRKVSSLTYIRNEYVAEYTKRRAQGICQLCTKPAPFVDTGGKPYLENHHIQWLSEGGSDTIDNTVALCPNCHRKMHMLNLHSDRVLLEKIIGC